jgi:hypothetical protein
MGYKRFNVIIDVRLDDEKYKKVSEWEGVEPTDFVRSVIQDHAQDRGLLVNIDVTESDFPLVDKLKEKRSEFMREDAMNEIEQEIMGNNINCVGGNCED